MLVLITAPIAAAVTIGGGILLAVGWPLAGLGGIFGGFGLFILMAVVELLLDPPNDRGFPGS